MLSFRLKVTSFTFTMLLSSICAVSSEMAMGVSV